MHVENNDKKKKKKAETVAMCFGRWKELTRDCCKERERGFWGLSMNKTLKPCVHVGGPYASYETDLSGL